MGTAFLNNWFLCLSFASYSHCSHPQEPLLIPTTDWEDARSLGTEVDLQVIRQAGNTRALHIMQLRNLAEEIDLLYQTFNNEKIKGNGISLVGGVFAIVTGVATIVSGGLALPALGTIGCVTGVAGGLWNISVGKKKKKIEQDIMEMIKEVIKGDKFLQEDVRKEMIKFDILDSTDRDIMGERLLTILRGWGAGTLADLGPVAAADKVCSRLTPLMPLFAKIDILTPLLEAAAKQAPKWFSNAADEAAKQKLRTFLEKTSKQVPEGWTKKYIIDNALGEIIKNHNGVEVAVKLSEEGTLQFANEVTETMLAETVKFAKYVGGVTAGLGAISCIWDAKQISEAWDGSKEGAKTMFGEALRRIASELENRMSNSTGG